MLATDLWTTRRAVDEQIAAIQAAFSGTATGIGE
jgi:hypothetical protein